MSKLENPYVNKPEKDGPLCPICGAKGFHNCKPQPAHCEVIGCVAVMDEPYSGQPVCQQVWAGDPESQRQFLEKCLMKKPLSQKAQVTTEEFAPAMFKEEPITTTEEVGIDEMIQRLDLKQAIFCLRAFMAADHISEKKMRAAIYIANEFGVRDEQY